MTQPTSQSPFHRLCLEVLKSIGRVLGQMNLYSAAHPSVKAMQGEALHRLEDVLEQSPGNILIYSIDQDKLIANGHVVGNLKSVPSAIAGLFSRFGLSTLTFKAGVTETELAEFCQLGALRSEQAKGLDLSKHLAEHQVMHIAVGKAVYVPVEALEGMGKESKKDDGTGAGGGQTGIGLGPGSGAALVSPGELAESLRAMPLEQSIRALVRYASQDPKDQELIFSIVTQRLKEELQTKVAQATKELNRAKTTLQNEQLRTQSVFDHMAEGVVVVDEQGKVLMMNANAEEIFAARLSDMAGKALEEGIKETHLLTLSKDIVVPNDQSITPEVKTVANEDTRRTLRASAAVIQNEAGKPVGVVSALSDTAKHRELQKMEREFVAHVTHELRAPLSSIRAALEILDGMFSGKLSDEEGRMMANALRNTNRLEGLVNEILDFSKIESGQMTVYPKPCQAEKIAQEAVDSLKPWAMKKGIQLSLEFAPGLPQVLSDPQRTVQVLVNLLSNAMKFTPKDGRVSVYVRSGAQTHSQSVVYSVRDTGPGIAKENQKKIFEKFVQIAMGEKHVGGTGLGLAIAKAFIHLQNGQMWVESELGQGAEFFFTLPRFRPPTESKEKEPAQRISWWKRLLGFK